MTSENFCYWLMGMLEVRGVCSLSQDEVQIIKNHLDLVFAHDIDPKAGPKEVQDKLNDIHSGKSKHPYNSGYSEEIRLRC